VYIIELFALVQTLQKRVEELEAKVCDLQNQLNRNSQNSHPPPSNDGFKKIKKQKRISFFSM
jgi:uncharacterized protein YlxW (UPF0749 family)